MAESVDALVSNTSGVTPVPVRPRLWVQQENPLRNSSERVFYIDSNQIYCSCVDIQSGNPTESQIIISSEEMGCYWTKL